MVLGPRVNRSEISTRDPFVLVVAAEWMSIDEMAAAEASGDALEMFIKRAALTGDLVVTAGRADLSASDLAIG